MKFEEWLKSDNGLVVKTNGAYLDDALTDIERVWLASRKAMAEELVAAIKSRAEDRVASFPELSFADGYHDGMLGATDIIRALIDKP